MGVFYGIRGEQADVSHAGERDVKRALADFKGWEGGCEGGVGVWASAIYTHSVKHSSFVPKHASPRVEIHHKWK